MTSRAFPAQGPADGHGLALSSGEIVHRGFQVLKLHLEPGKIFGGGLFHGLFVQDLQKREDGGPGQFGPHEDVLINQQPGGQGQLLVDGGHPLAQGVGRRGEPDLLAEEIHFSGGGPLGSGDDPDQSALARPVVPAQGQDLALGHGKIDPAQSPNRARTPCR